MRAVKAKQLRKMAREDAPDAVAVHYEWIDPGVYLKVNKPETIVRTTRVCVDCQRATYKFFKQLYKSASRR